ncbi:MAG: choice-of-anchor D domain-containing protein, partial [bacterium]
MARKLRTALASILAVAALGAIAPAANAYVYWANFGSGSIARANLDGTNPEQSFISGLSQVLDVAVDSNYIYWNDQGTSIARANLDGTGVNRSFVGSAGSPTNVAVYGGYIYYVNSNGNSIGRVGVNGSSQDNGCITGLIAASDRAYGVEVDSTGIYVASFNNNRILRWDLNGTNRTYLFDTAPQTGPTGIALRNPYLYTANFDSDSIGRGQWVGTDWSKKFVSGVSLGDPNGVAVDANHIFWTNTLTNTIGRSNLDGTSPNGSLVTGASGPSGMTIDALSPAADLTPSTYDYGDVKASGGEKPMTFTLTSAGNVPLTVGGFSIGGSEGENFGILGGGTCVAGVTTLSNGQSCTVMVNFAPLTLGAKSAALDITTNAGVKSLSLSGTGVGIPTLTPLRTTKTSLKLKVGCGDADSCSLRLTGKKVGSNAAFIPKTVAIGAGQQPVVTLYYSSALERALAQGGRLSVIATRLNATGAVTSI